MGDCKHEFSFKVGVAIFEDKPGNGSAEISGGCVHCGTPVLFQGPRGACASFAVASVDRTELRAPVTFGAAEYSPSITALFEGPEFAPKAPH